MNAQSPRVRGDFVFQGDAGASDGISESQLLGVAPEMLEKRYRGLIPLSSSSFGAAMLVDPELALRASG
jgi:hypothetical protein